MKLNAFTNPVIQIMPSAASKTSLTVGSARPLTSTTATSGTAAACQISRRPAGSPCTSSASPSSPNAATAKPKTAASAPPISPAATSNPAATGIPPPRGVGTV